MYNKIKLENNQSYFNELIINFRRALFMKKLFKLFGSILLSVAALITITGPASASGIGIEEMPKSISNKR